ncbi:MAG: response regulator [Deltaproteobacteria bacterium]|nr:MAG: response regulator [Deltaproteobacteria bacterium]
MKDPVSVLVVDDDEFILKMVAELLEKKGFRVATASNTIGAGYMLKEFDPDVVVLDIMLPGSLSGDAACDTLRQLKPGIKILFFSGMDESQLAKLGERHKADAVLSKGGRINKLVETIESLCES